jgi:carboxylesterase
LERIYGSTEPFELQGYGNNARIAIMLIHGFTGSPSELRRIGYYLNDLGYTVKGILLPGHGTTPEAMHATGWKEWYDQVLSEYERLVSDQRTQHVVAVGHSMGGLLALMLASERKLSGVASLSAPIYLKSRKTLLAWPLQYFVKYIHKKPKQRDGWHPAAADDVNMISGADTNHDHGQQQIRIMEPVTVFEEACSYDRTPVRSIVSLRRLISKVKKRLAAIETPILIAQGKKDRVVQAKSAAYIHQQIGSPNKRLSYYAHSSHGMLLDRERKDIYADIHAFIDELHPASNLLKRVID